MALVIALAIAVVGGQHGDQGVADAHSLPATQPYGIAMGFQEPGKRQVSVPAEPVELQVVTESGSLSVSVDWDDVEGATHYLVRWRVPAPGNELNEGVEVESSDANFAVDDFGTWVVRVEACNGAGCGDPTARRFEVESTGEPAPEPTPEPTPDPEVSVPARPAGLQVVTESGSHDVSVDWDDVEGASYYLVRWRPVASGGKLNEGVQVQSSDADVTVVDSGEWVVRVEACNSAGCGDPATRRFEVEPASGSGPEPDPEPTPDPEASVPARPAGLEVDTAPGSLDVSVDWDDVEGASHYLVRWRVLVPGNRLNDGEEVQSSDAGIALAGFGQWVVRVQACNDAGCGDPTARQFEVEPATNSEPARSPGGLQVVTVPGSLKVSVDWDDVGGTTHYLVRWRAPAPGSKLNEGVGVQSSAARITLDDFGEWVVRVEACNGTGCSQPLVRRFEVEPAPATQVNNSPPAFDDGASPLTRSVAENSAADAAVGAAVAATDPDGDTLTYTLTGTDAGSFTIDGNGQIKVGQGTSFDRATKAGYSVTVNVSDGKDSSGGDDTFVDASVDVSIAVQAASSPPTFDEGAGPLTRSVAENSEADSAVGSAVAATDPDGDTLTYTLTGADAGSFTIVGAGQIKVGKGTTFDRATKASYSVTVNVSDGKDSSGGDDAAVDASVDVTVSVTPVLPPAFAFKISALTFDEAGEIDVRLPEAEGGEGELTYTLSGLPTGLSFDADTRIMSGSLPSPPANGVRGASGSGEHTLVYTAKDGAGAEASFSFTINVRSALRRALSEDIDGRRPHVRNMQVARKTYSGASPPGFTVTWREPESRGDSGETDLVVEQYELRYKKRGTSVWTDVSISEDSRSVELTRLEAGTVYHVRLRVKFSGDRYTEWSFANAQGEHTTNSPPTLSDDSFIADASYPWGAVGELDNLAGFFTDADGDTLTYTASYEHPGVMKASVNGTTLWTDFRNPGTTTLTYGAHDGFGGYVSRTATISSTGTVTRSVRENSAAGTTVGARVPGMPYDDGDDETDDALTYTLHGEAAGAFVIDSATGQISVKQGASLDYETKASYTGQVKWTVQGQVCVANLTINITDAEVGKPDAPTVTRKTSSEPIIPALDVSWPAAPANGTTITGYKAKYRVKADEGEDPNRWTAYTGTLSATKTSLVLSNLPEGVTYEVQVRALTSLEGEGPWSDTGSGRANRRPALTAFEFTGVEIAAGSSIEYRETGQPSAALFFTDVDGDALTYTATTGPPGLLGAGLSGTGGSAHLQLTALNQGSATVTLTAIDPYGGEVRRTATFTITASEERSILEFSPAGTAVGDPVTGTPYQGKPLVYSLAGNIVESGLFVINSATGQISVAEGAVIDSSVVDSHREAMEGQESKQFYSGEVRYRVGDQNAAIQVRIFVTQVMPGAPGRPTLAPETSSETGNPGLDASWTAADGNGLTLTGYQVRYRKQGATEWTPHSGALPASAASTILPDLDATTTYEAQVRAVANIGPPADIFLSVDKTSLRESPQSYDVTVTATRQGTSGEVTVALAFSGTAIIDADYRSVPSAPTITIADGATSGTVELRLLVVTDGEKEGSETIILSGTAGQLIVGSVVVTVIDNDYPGEPIMASPERFGPWSETGTGITGERNTITLSASPDAIGEDAGATEVTVSATLNAALAADTVVILALSGTAAAPADYSATSAGERHHPQGADQRRVER